MRPGGIHSGGGAAMMMQPHSPFMHQRLLGGLNDIFLDNPLIYSYGTMYEGFPNEYVEVTVGDDNTASELREKLGGTIDGKPLHIIVRPMPVAYGNSLGKIWM